jgi:hypothetical protein
MDSHILLGSTSQNEEDDTRLTIFLILTIFATMFMRFIAGYFFGKNGDYSKPSGRIVPKHGINT